MSSASSYTLCFLCFLPLFVVAQNTIKITLGSSLTAGEGFSWVSPSGDFAFGFQLVGTQSYLLAIWFNKIPQKTITWSANRDALAQRGSKLHLTAGGRLILNDPSGSEMWNATASGVVAYAAILDTGNLVLANFRSIHIWQSFHSPTDTILPTQIMSEGTYLNSRLSDTNYATGRFQLIMQGDGNFVSYMIYSPKVTDHYLPAYDATNVFGTDLQVVFNESGSIYVTTTDGSPQATVLGNHTDQALYLQRAVLEFDGVFRKYVYPRSSPTPVDWTLEDLRPTDICSRVSVTTGTGVCGSNGVCQIGDGHLQRPKCECPSGYLFFDQTDQAKGCKPNFTQQSCMEDPQGSSQFQLVEMLNTNFPDSSSYQILTGISELPCHSSCLSDCFCAALVFGDEICHKMRLPFTNGWVNQSGISTKAFIKVRIGNSTGTKLNQPDPSKQPIGGVHKGKEHKSTILIESVFLGSSVFINLLLLSLVVFIVTFCTYERKVNIRADQDIPGTTMRNFSYKELEEATNGFKEVVGQGAFATVYKGLLDSEEGDVIAVKKLNEMVKDNQREFESEVKAIAKTGHRNLVRLIGYCNEGRQHRLLVYEYMPNGSLADILFHDQRPNLSRRMKFALETARGLNYLHEECGIQIIHCDIKLQNILLDDTFTTRISDFGLAKLLKKDQAHTMTGIRGTKGYVAPEWFKSVPVTTKVDVYSYGILLLELICCRRCFEAEVEDESQMVLVDWAYDCYEEGRVDELVESDAEAMDDLESIKKFVLIALWCVQENPSLRPSMKKVIQMIQGSVEGALPPDLASDINCMNAV